MSAGRRDKFVGMSKCGNIGIATENQLTYVTGTRTVVTIKRVSQAAKLVFSLKYVSSQVLTTAL